MRHVAVIAFFLVACAPQTSMVGHVRRVSSAAVVLDLAGEKAVETLIRAQDIQHQKCEALLGSTEYQPCMGELGEPMAPLFQEFGRDFDELASRLRAMEESAVRIDQRMDAARRVLKEAKE